MTKNEMTVKNQELKDKLATLIADLATEHPNHCTSCAGVGGSLVGVGDGWHEPSNVELDECKDCLERGNHPLDLNRSMTEEEVEAWVEAIYEGEGVPDILVKIEDTERELELVGEYQEHLEMEEAERCWEAIYEQAALEDGL